MSRILAVKRLCFPVFCIAVLLSGCGGSSSSNLGSSNEPNTGPDIGSLKAGYFSVTTPSGPDIAMILSPSGECMIKGATYKAVSFCSIEVNDDSISGTLESYSYNNDQWELTEGILSGTVTAPETANLVIKIGNQTSNPTIARINDESDNGINLNILSGTYSVGAVEYEAGNFDVTFTVDTDGVLIGSDGTGCNFNGTVTIPDPKLNIYEMTYTASNCGANGTISGSERDGEYSGLSIFYASAGLNLMVATNGKIATTFGGTL